MYCDTINLPHCQMTVYIPDLVADPAVRRPTVVIAPGGGYTHLSTRESEPVALTFAAMGMNAVVVRYRVAPAVFPAPMQDIASTVAAIRQNADNWHADPNQIALCGFSAGAHAAGLLGVHWQEAHWWQELHLTSADVRPNALILSYPVITAGEFAHRGSFPLTSRGRTTLPPISRIRWKTSSRLTHRRRSSGTHGQTAQCPWKIRS